MSTEQSPSTTVDYIKLAGERKAPRYKHEKAKHRLISQLAMQGLTNLKIAEIVGVTPQTVSNVLGQDFSRNYMAAKFDKSIENVMDDLLSNASLLGAQALVDILECKTAKHSDKISAAKLAMDRRYGTAPQTIQHTNLDLTKASDAQLEAIIAGN